MKKFRNKYRIQSARAQWWDYGWNGAYFITGCTRFRRHYFGEIRNNRMILSETGIIADNLWREIPNHFPFIDLGEFVVMPNHFHGILIMDKPAIESGRDVETGQDVRSGPAETGHALSLPPEQPLSSISTLSPPQSPGQKRAGNQGKQTSSSIVGGYKSAVTKQANLMGCDHGWKTRFHDHIIRDHGEYQRISNYIATNPQNWRDDRFYTP